MPRKPKPELPPGTAKEREEAAQRARARKAAAMGPGREDAEDVLADVIAVMDLDTRRLKLKAEAGEALTVGESQTLGNYVRSLSSAITARANAGKVTGKTREEDMSDDELNEKEAQIQRKLEHARKAAS